MRQMLLYLGYLDGYLTIKDCGGNKTGIPLWIVLSFVEEDKTCSFNFFVLFLCVSKTLAYLIFHER